MPNYDAQADLHRYQVNTVKPGHPIQPSPRFLHAGKFSDLVKQVIAKREPDGHLYEITTDLYAGFQRTVFKYSDIVDVYNSPDFPR